MKFQTTPWGTPDHVQQVADGVWLISTPSHGGFYLDETRNARVPMSWQQGSFRQQGMRGWYEEDCDAPLVVMSLPELFDADEVRRAHDFLQMWWSSKLPTEVV